MTTSQGIQQMPLDRIAQVVAPVYKHGKRNGLLIGVAIDVVMIALVWKTLNDWSDLPQGGTMGGI